MLNNVEGAYTSDAISSIPYFFFFPPEKFGISLVYLSYYSLHKQNMNITSTISEAEQSNKIGLSQTVITAKLFFSKKGYILPLLFSEIIRGDQNKLCCETDEQRLPERSTRCISKLNHSKQSRSRLPAAALPARCTLRALAVPPGAWRSVRCLIDVSPPRAGFVQSACR